MVSGQAYHHASRVTEFLYTLHILSKVVLRIHLMRPKLVHLHQSIQVGNLNTFQ